MVKDVTKGCNVKGNPAKIIGNLKKKKKKRENIDKGKSLFDSEEINRRIQLWDDFIKGEQKC